MARIIGNPTSRRARVALAVLALVLVGLLVASISTGSSGSYPLDRTFRGLVAAFGWGEPLEGAQQTIVELRLWRTLVTAAVGAALALSGGLLQGVFRNDLASPFLIGVSSGAALGAAGALLILGGYGPMVLLEGTSGASQVFVAVCAFVGALGVTALVTALSTTGGRISVPTLLLVGIAVNAIAGGLLAAIQSFVLQDFEVARAIFAWGFGTLEDRSAAHAASVGGALVLGAAVIPFVATELDLFAGGEEDARALGVPTGRVKALALGAAALSAAAAVAVAGQIAFVGLIVPHVLRLGVERSHRALLPLCLVSGAVFLLGTDLAQRVFLGDAYLQPGVAMSLLGGPFFLSLLVRQRANLRTW